MAGDKDVSTPGNGGGTPGSPAAGVSFNTVRAAFRRRPWLTAGAVLAAAVVGVVVWLVLPVPKMTGYALFLIHSRPQYILNPHESQDFNLYRQSQGAMIKSRLVLNAALSEKPAMGRAQVLDGENDKITALEKKLTVDFKSGQEFMRLSIEGDDAAELTLILDAVSKCYLDHVVNNKKNSDRNRRDKLLELQKSLQTDITAAINRLKRQSEEENSFGVDEKGDFTRARKAKLTDNLLEVEAKLQRAKLELQLLGDPDRMATTLTAVAGVVGSVVPRDGLSLVALPPGTNLAGAIADRLREDTEYQETRRERDRLKTLVEVSKRFAQPGATPPSLVAFERDLQAKKAICEAREAQARTDAEAQLKQAALRGLAAARTRLQAEVAMNQALKDSFDKELKELSGGFRRLPSDRFEAELARKELEDKQKLLQQTQTELTTIQLEAEAPDRVIKLERDVVQGSEGYKRVKYTGVAVLAALVLGLGALILLEKRNPRVLDGRQVTGELGVPLIGVLPALKPEEPLLDKEEAGEPTGWRLALGEAVNMAAAVLQHGITSDRPARTILIASALSGEGKTSLAVLLANSLARAGHRTLLIDGDLRRPTVHHSLSLPPGLGLSDYLAGRADLSQVLRPSTTPGLTAVTGGRWHPAAPHALSTPRWEELLAQAVVEYDYVIIDSAPVLPVADTLLMARKVDGVLLSVMRDVSELPAVKDALAQLALVGTRVLGVVINRAPTPNYHRTPYMLPALDPAPAEQTNV
ncbi:MAG TPA: polysaccharide biosynthesis tyrosine autokinase [Fimbriiglobus sp.]|nr:polysaccharide biosynthesis tyrosine autokinase [Fimbriiglobus sp.]